MNLVWYPNPDICTPTVKQNNDMTYAQGFTAVILLFIQGLRLLLLLLLLTVAFVLWTWGISFQAGRMFRRWFEIETPTPLQTIYKLGEIVVFPFVVIARWSRQKVKNLLQIELPLLPSSPPEKCSDLLPATKDKDS